MVDYPDSTPTINLNSQVLYIAAVDGLHNPCYDPSWVQAGNSLYRKFLCSHMKAVNRIPFQSYIGADPQDSVENNADDSWNDYILIPQYYPFNTCEGWGGIKYDWKPNVFFSPPFPLLLCGPEADFKKTMGGSTQYHFKERCYWVAYVSDSYLKYKDEYLSSWTSLCADWGGAGYSPNPRYSPQSRALELENKYNAWLDWSQTRWGRESCAAQVWACTGTKTCNLAK